MCRAGCGTAVGVKASIITAEVLLFRECGKQISKRAPGLAVLLSSLHLEFAQLMGLRFRLHIQAHMPSTGHGGVGAFLLARFHEWRIAVHSALVWPCGAAAAAAAALFR